MKQMNLNQVVRSIDRRLERVEQILPTLPTREELNRKVAGLATRAEMHAAIHEAVAPLATREQLREQFERSRRHSQVLFESLMDRITALEDASRQPGGGRRSPN